MKRVTQFFQQWNVRVSMSPAEFRELSLSHHPNLPCFNDDVVIICNKRICAGCLFAYPTALLTLLLIHPSGYSGVLTALVLAGFSQMRRFTTNNYLQNGFRLIAGIALGFGLGSGYWAIMEGQWGLVILLAIGASVYALLKLNSMKKKMRNFC